MPTILLTTSSFALEENDVLRQLQQQNFTIKMNPYGRRLTEAEVKELLQQDVVAMIAGVEPLTRAVIESAKSLRIISRCGVGLDNVDQDAVNERGIQLYNVDGVLSTAVAEFTLTLMLNLLRHVTEADRSMRKREWKALSGNLLANKTVGIIGFGSIGRQVAKYVTAFDANVLVCDPLLTANDLKEPLVSLNELAASSDIVTLHVPYSQTTHHLIDQEFLSNMQSHAYIINVARGGVLDEHALLLALRENKIAGAALDVFAQEPYNGDLLGIKNVLLTAHMGGYAQEARLALERAAAANLVRGLQLSE